MMKTILMLGGETSLGEAFCEEAVKIHGHHIHHLVEDDFRLNSNTLRTAIPQFRFDWVVNCFGYNRLQKIGAMHWLTSRDLEREPPESGRFGFSNSMLVDNVAPILWVVNELVRRGHPGARVLSVASQTYRIPQTSTALYCASKAALVQLSKVMARELAEKGWVINCLAPGKIQDTRMAELTDQQVENLRGWTVDEANAYALRNIPMRRYTSRAEVSQAMFVMLERMPDYVNGTCIDMTGGA